MKNLLLILTFLLGINTIAFSQNWKFSLVGTGEDITNTVRTVGVYNTDQIHLDFDVLNISNVALDAYVTRKIITQPGTDGWWEQVCFGNNNGTGFCDNMDSLELEWTCDNSVTITPGIFPGDSGLVNVKVNPIPAEAPGVYRYYIGIQGDLYQDSVDLVFFSTVSVEEIEKEMTLSVSPNPAKEFVSITVSNFEKGNLKVVDVLGNVIKNTSFTGSKTLNVAEFRNGVYFIMISGEGVKSINRKLVIRH